MDTAPIVTELEFGDLESVIAGYPGTDWQMDLRQINNGSVFCRIRSLEFEDLTVIWNTESLGSLADYRVPREHTLLALQVPGNFRLRWCGSDIDPDLMFISNSGRDYVLASRGGFDCLALIVSNDLLVAAPECREALCGEGAVRTVPLGAPGRRLRAWLLDVFSDTGRITDLSENPAIAVLFRDALLQSLQDILVSCEAVAPIESGARYRLAERAREFMRASDSLSLTAEEVATALGVSSRLLRYAFREAYDLSPYQYLLFDRLAEAHRRLSARSVRDISVSRVAADVGLLDFGRFSRFYRRTYGVTPSETLNRTRRC